MSRLLPCFSVDYMPQCLMQNNYDDDIADFKDHISMANQGMDYTYEHLNYIYMELPGSFTAGNITCALYTEKMCHNELRLDLEEVSRTRNLKHLVHNKLCIL